MKLIIIMLLLPINLVFGAEVIIEQGGSNPWFSDSSKYQSAQYTAVAMRFGERRFIEVIQGGWAGEHSANFSGLGVGFRTDGQYYLDSSIGAVHLFKPETERLDGRNQFLLSLGIGARIDNLRLGVRLRHLSNGGTKGKNDGVDFLGGSIGIIF